MGTLVVIDAQAEQVRSALREEYGDAAADLTVEARRPIQNAFSLGRKGEGTALEAVVKLAEAIAVGAAGSATNDLLKDAARRLRARFGADRVREEQESSDPAIPPPDDGGSAEGDDA